MTSALHTSDLLQDFLSSMDHNEPPGRQGRTMMSKKLRWYLHRLKQQQPVQERNTISSASASADVPGRVAGTDANAEVSLALRKKDQERQRQQANRRRVRGGAPSAGGSRPDPSNSATSPSVETDHLTALYVALPLRSPQPNIIAADFYSRNYGMTSCLMQPCLDLAKYSPMHMALLQPKTLWLFAHTLMMAMTNSLLRYNHDILSCMNQTLTSFGVLRCVF